MSEQIFDFIDSYKVSIVHGGTGCGKTTQVPQYILDQYLLLMYLKCYSKCLNDDSCVAIYQV